MAPPSQLIQYPHLLPILLLLAAAVASDHSALHQAAAASDEPQDQTQQQGTMGRPGCRDKCGGMTIPFPFGMDKPDCFFLPGYEVTCNTSFTPPRAFLAYSRGSAQGPPYKVINQNTFGMEAGDSPEYRYEPVELFDISLETSEVRVYGGVSSRCFTNETVGLEKGEYVHLDGYGPFLLSAGNDLVGVGWNVKPAMTYQVKASSEPLSCTSSNPFLLTAPNGSCSGLGCCHIPLPPPWPTMPVTETAVTLNDDNDINIQWRISPCSYGMVVERSWYNFTAEDMFGYEVLSRKLGARGFPLVLDFAIRYARCEQDSCPSGNSSCAEAANDRNGHVCKCWEHYQGNPYIANGCQDIDECQLREQSPEFRDLYPCDGICTNIPGGYDCRCKRGMKGDAKKGNCTEIFPLPAKIIVGISGLIAVFIIMVMAKQHLKLKKFYEQNGGPILNGVKNIRIYTRKQLKQITNNYETVIGHGHFGKVYKGTLKDKQQVAVKKSIKVDKDMKKEFTDEVIIQSEMRHKNIVRLLGCCYSLEFDVPMLVYEFVEKGSLYDVLFKSKDSIPVNKRLAIAIGSAEGLAYMHSAGESTIHHGDVKSANILLDGHFNPKVSDFGTSKLLAKGKEEETDRVIGNMSYIDPIYMEKGIVTQKSDVYSFGVVLIELITRRPATYDVKRSYVANFVQSCVEKGARNFNDNDVTSEVDINMLEMVSGVAVDCLKPNPEERQDMKQVEHRLLEIVGQPVSWSERN